MAKRGESGSALRREVLARERGPGRRYPEELRERAARWAVEQRRAGASWEELGGELGLRVDTLRRWVSAEPRGAAPRSGERDVAMVPVRVISAPSERTFAVVSPTGYRLEGVTLAEAASLLGALR